MKNRRYTGIEEQKVDWLGTLRHRFCFVSCNQDWALEKLATWKYQWTQTKKIPKKSLQSLAKVPRKGHLSEKTLFPQLQSNTTGKNCGLISPLASCKQKPRLPSLPWSKKVLSPHWCDLTEGWVENWYFYPWPHSTMSVDTAWDDWTFPFPSCCSGVRGSQVRARALTTAK